MKKVICVTILCMCTLLTGCDKKKSDTVKVGVSFGVGEAARWPQEMEYMKKRAKELNIEIETRLNKKDTPLTQNEDCREMIDKGIDVLILTPRDIHAVAPIIEYAKEKDVKVISYARASWNVNYDLFIGYDTYLLGKELGKFASEKVYEGNYIILKGDKNDYNSDTVYEGMMQNINLIKDDITILLDAYVPNWDRAKAKQMVFEAVKKNKNKVDAILAPNDKLAGASAEALEELGIDPSSVLITGMDAELDAIKRIAKGTQSVSQYMDLKELAYTAIDRAQALATQEKVEANSELDNASGSNIPSYLISGKMITKENIDALLIKPGYFTKEEVYGK